MVTHHDEEIFSSKGGNIFMGLCGNLLFLVFHSNGMHFIIFPWSDYVIMVGYWFSHMNHLLVGLQNLPLQLWLFPVNLSGNNVADKLITGSCSVSFLYTDLAILITCNTM